MLSLRAGVGNDSGVSHDLCVRAYHTVLHASGTMTLWQIVSASLAMSRLVELRPSIVASTRAGPELELVLDISFGHDT